MKSSNRCIRIPLLDKSPVAFFINLIKSAVRREMVSKRQLRATGFGDDDRILILKDIEMATAIDASFPPGDSCLRRGCENKTVLHVRSLPSNRHKLLVGISLKAAQDVIGSDIGVPSGIVWPVSRIALIPDEAASFPSFFDLKSPSGLGVCTKFEDHVRRLVTRGSEYGAVHL